MNAGVRIFVYGTLKKGFSNHDCYCEGVSKVVPARLRGRLFKLMPEVPVMIVPESDILAAGSVDVGADVRLLAEFKPEASRARERFSRAGGPANSPPSGNWKTINGEILFFDDPEKRMPLIDGLEEFRPGEPSTYLRVLVSAFPADGPPLTVWTYIAGFNTRKLEEYEGETWFPDA